MADVSSEAVEKTKIISVVERLAEIKRKEILEVCYAKEYTKDYSIHYVSIYAESFKVGLQDGIELVTRHPVESLLRDC